MKKRLLTLMLTLSMILTITAPALAADTVTATPTASTVLVNGKTVAFDAYTINGNNYFKLRDLAYTLSGTAKQFDVGWDGEKNAISLTSGNPYTATGGEMTAKGAGSKTAAPTSSKIYLDGKEVTFTAYNIDGNNYFKLRDIGLTFDFSVEWDGAKNTIVIDTSKGYTAENIGDSGRVRSEKANASAMDYTFMVYGGLGSMGPVGYLVDGEYYVLPGDLSFMLNGDAKQFAGSYNKNADTYYLELSKPCNRGALDESDWVNKDGEARAVYPTVLLDGIKADVFVYRINGRDYFNLNDMAKALDFCVQIDNVGKEVLIYATSSSRYFDGSNINSTRPTMFVTSMDQLKDVPSSSSLYDIIYFLIRTEYKPVICYTDGYFRPDKNISKAETVEMLFNTQSKRYQYEQAKPDEHWAYQYTDDNRVLVGYYTKGIANISNFEDSITRAEMAALAYNYYVLFGSSSRYIKDEGKYPLISALGDAASIPEKYRWSIESCLSLGLMKTDENNNFNPNGFVTRAEMMHICYQIIFD